MASGVPARSDQRLALTKEIQRELRRVGCYAGPLDGAWPTRAGDRALAVFANQEAERHYHAALETLAEAVNGDRPVRAHALAGLGEALYRQGRYEQAIGTWRDAIPLYQQAGDSSLAAIHIQSHGRSNEPA